MPFKSEAQRKYLWANEPEIARDWTDTYGSRIHKLHGGITHADGRRGFPGGSGREGDTPMGTTSSGALSSGANYGYSNVHDTGAVSQTPGRTTSTGKGGEIDQMLNRTFKVEKPKGFFSNLASGIWGLRKFSPTYQALQLAKKAFTPQTPQQKLQANINKK